MSEILRMSNRQAEESLKQIRRQIHDKYSFCMLDFQKNESVGNGFVESEYDHIDGAAIGIKELRSDPQSDPKLRLSDEEYREAPVDDYYYMCALVTEFHELTHIAHAKSTIYKRDPSSSLVMIGKMVDSASTVYYEKNYHIMPHEISAQYSGIRNAHKLLTEKLGSEKADALVCDYVNKHKKDEFIDFPENGEYTNVDDIFDAYDKAFRNSKTAKRELNFDDIEATIQKFKNNEISPFEQPDYLVKYLMQHEGEKQALKDIMQTKSGIEQDMFVAKTYLFATDPKGKIRKQLASLKAVDFGEAGVTKEDTKVDYAARFLKGQYITSDHINPLYIDDTTYDFAKDVDNNNLDLF